MEVVRDFSLLDRFADAVLDQLGCFLPTQVLEHHNSREHYRARIDDVEVRVLGSGAVGGFKDSVAIANVGARRNAQSADLRSASVGDVIAVEVGSGQNLILLW